MLKRVKNQHSYVVQVCFKRVLRNDKTLRISQNTYNQFNCFKYFLKLYRQIEKGSKIYI